MRLFYLLVFSALAADAVFAQGSFFGGLQLNTNFYVRDTAIGASGTPHYDNLKNSTDAWLNLDYMNDQFGIDAGIRLDVFAHSNLHEPNVPYTGVGIGNWYVRKRGEKYRITGGHFYDQFGSGIVFRAYEDRTFGIDNAILGVHAEVDPVEQLQIKAFAGVQKNRFEIYRPIIMGLNLESQFSLGKKIQIIPGISVVNRTMDQESMDFVVSLINSKQSGRFIPKYNVYVFGGYNTLNFGNFSWYVEAAGKTSEAIFNQEQDLVDRGGNVFYTTFSYTPSLFGITLQFKRTENFTFRTSPNETLLEGIINFIPPVTRQNSLQLPGRYIAAVQDLEELSYSGDITYSPIAKKLTFNLNYSEVRDFSNDLKFREALLNSELKFKKSWKALAGFQFIQYDQAFFEGEAYGDYKYVEAYTPFVEFTWKVTRKHSLIFDLQWQFTEEDFGSWIYAQVEYSIAPWFSVAVADMYNYKLNDHHFEPHTQLAKQRTHYYRFFTSFTYKAHVLTLGYVKQVSGIVCTGGVCRYEPAFSGLKLSINSSF